MSTSEAARLGSATMPTSAMYLALAGGALPDSPLAKVAAVAEPAATTTWREEAKLANAD